MNSAALLRTEVRAPGAWPIWNRRSMELYTRYEAMKLKVGRTMGQFRSKQILLREAEALRAEAEELRARLVAAQQAKATALGQAEEARKERERLRTRVASAKIEIDSLKKIQTQLHEKLAALKEANDLLSEKLAKKRK